MTRDAGSDNMAAMRTLMILGAFLALTACWNARTGGAGGGGSGGAGGSGGERDCYRCGEVAFSGEPRASLCSGSMKPLENVEACGCGQGPCGVECYDNLCSGAGADPTCEGCMQLKCASDYALCSKDQSR